VQSGKKERKIVSFDGDGVKLMEEGKVRKVLFGI